MCGELRDEENAAEEILVEVKQRRQQTEDDMWTELEQKKNCLGRL